MALRTGSLKITIAPHLSAAEHEWTVLIIGDGPLGAELSNELERLGQDVDDADTDSACTAVIVSAPDLVVLVGDAASDRGAAVLAALADGTHSAVAPVMVIGDSSRAQVHPNYRHGPVAALSNKLPIPLLAKRVLDLARDVPDRTGEQTGPVTGDQLETLVEGLASDKRSGTLDVTPPNAQQSESLLMAAGESVSEPASEFMARVQPQLRNAPGSFRFKERSGGSTDSVAPPPAGSVELAPAPTSTVPPPPSVRVLVVDGDPVRAESLAQALRDRGAIAEGIGGNVGALEGASRTDAQVVLMTPTHLRTKCKAVVAAIEVHPRLRWASTLLAPQGLLWPADGSEPNLDVLQRKFDKLTEPDRRLICDALAGRTETRLEVIGPGRMLRAIATCGEPRRVVVRHPRVKIAITVEAGSLVQATAKPVGDVQPVEGSAALAALFAIRSGRVEITPTKPAITLKGLPSIEDALARALRMESPIAASIMPPARGGKRPSPQAVAPPPPVGAEPPSVWGLDDAAASPPPPPPIPHELENPDALLAPPSGLFDPPSTQSEGSGVIELASGPLPLSAVLEHPPSSSIARGGTAELEFDLQATLGNALNDEVSDDDGDMPALPRLAAAAAARRALDGAKRFSAAAVRTLRGARVNPAIAREALLAGLVEVRRGVTAVPRRVLYGALAALAAIVMAAALWPDASQPVEGSTDTTEPVADTAAAAATAPVAKLSAGPSAAPDPTEPSGATLPDEAQEGAVDEEEDEDEEEEADQDDSDAPAEGSTSDNGERAARIALARDLAHTATALRRQGRLGLAESKYREALAAWPRYPLAMAGVVRLHLARKDGREAVRWARKLVHLQPRRGNNQLLLGDAYMLRRNVKGARAAYRQSVRYGNRTAKKRLDAL